jgi:hypothetical protein
LYIIFIVMIFDDEFSQKIVWNENTTWRNGYKWSVNESLRLEREFDLLNLSVPEIAKLHNRTENAIMYKIHKEGWDTYNNLYIKTYGIDYLNDEMGNVIQNEDEDDSSDEEYVPDLDDDDNDDDEYVQNLEEYDNNSQEIKLQVKNGYLIEQLKGIQTQISKMLSYFSFENTLSDPNYLNEMPSNY